MLTEALPPYTTHAPEKLLQAEPSDTVVVARITVVLVDVDEGVVKGL